MVEGDGLVLVFDNQKALIAFKWSDFGSVFEKASAFSDNKCASPNAYVGNLGFVQPNSFKALCTERLWEIYPLCL